MTSSTSTSADSASTSSMVFPRCALTR
jgi:hypothetical protein